MPWQLRGSRYIVSDRFLYCQLSNDFIPGMKSSPNREFFSPESGISGAGHLSAIGNGALLL
jgi:hypothetical protein